MCLPLDFTGQLGWHTTEDIMSKGLFAQMLSDTTWVFRQIYNGEEMFRFKGYKFSTWRICYNENKEPVMWNIWTDRDKCYYKVDLEDGQIRLGEKVDFFDSTFDYLTEKAHFSNKRYRSLAIELGREEKRYTLLQNQEKIKRYVKDTLDKEFIISTATGTNPLFQLIRNKVNGQYHIVYGDRKSNTVYLAKTKLPTDKFKPSALFSNHRQVHSHFRNIWFDGLDTITISEGESHFKMKIEQS